MGGSRGTRARARARLWMKVRAGVNVKEEEGSVYTYRSQSALLLRDTVAGEFGK